VLDGNKPNPLYNRAGNGKPKLIKGVKEMILKKETLKKLIREGKARYTGGTEKESIINDNNRKYIAVDRLDKQRVDHYEYEA
jgi:hypothetical protein